MAYPIMTGPENQTVATTPVKTSGGTGLPARLEMPRIANIPPTTPTSVANRPVQPRVERPAIVPAARRISGEVKTIVVAQSPSKLGRPTQPRLAPPNTETGQATKATTSAMRSRANEGIGLFMGPTPPTAA